MKTCIICNQLLSGRQEMFCSKVCKFQYYRTNERYKESRKSYYNNNKEKQKEYRERNKDKILRRIEITIDNMSITPRLKSEGLAGH
jgi:hypothetical protein